MSASLAPSLSPPEKLGSIIFIFGGPVVLLGRRTDILYLLILASALGIIIFGTRPKPDAMGHSLHRSHEQWRLLCCSTCCASAYVKSNGWKFVFISLFPVCILLCPLIRGWSTVRISRAILQVLFYFMGSGLGPLATWRELRRFGLWNRRVSVPGISERPNSNWTLVVFDRTGVAVWWNSNVRWWWWK